MKGSTYMDNNGIIKLNLTNEILNSITISGLSNGSSNTIEIQINTTNYKQCEFVANKQNNKAFLYCQNSRGANGKALLTQDGILVCKGSKIAKHFTDSFKKNKKYFNKYNELVDGGIIKERVFTEDYMFKSLSEASSIIMGVVNNGHMEWKTETGKSLKKLIKGNRYYEL